MRKWILILLFAAGCGTIAPTAVNIRNGKGYCPICAEWHEAAAMRWPTEYQGKRFRFCDPNCRATFEAEPERWLKDPEFNPRE